MAVSGSAEPAVYPDRRPLESGLPQPARVARGEAGSPARPGGRPDGELTRSARHEAKTEAADLAHVRVSFIHKATLTHEAGSEEALLLDLGLRGVFVERSAPLAADSVVQVSFRLPGNELPVVARCRVAWWHPAGAPLRRGERPAGHGLEFVALAEADRQRIRRHLEAHERRAVRARQYARPWPDEEGE